MATTRRHVSHKAQVITLIICRLLWIKAFIPVTLRRNGKVCLLVKKCFSFQQRLWFVTGTDIYDVRG